MKRKIYILLAAAVMMLSYSSCREQSDDILSYGQNDAFTFAAADTSYAEQFKALWTALNCNYGIWDYEAQFGLDWDAVYATYLPKMQALDMRDPDTNPVSNKELSNLYQEIFAPLHDGHFAVQVKNLHTQDFIIISPSYLRNANRPDINITHVPSFDYYLTSAAGEDQMTEYIDVSVDPEEYINDEIKKATAFIDGVIASLSSKASPTDLEAYLLTHYQKARKELSDYIYFSEDDIPDYNKLADKYEYLGVVLNPFTITDSDNFIHVRYANFGGNILYLGFSGFNLTPFLSGSLAGSACGDHYTQLICRIYATWLQQIQDQQKAGTLKGVILDMRNNRGGTSSEYRLALGALLPAGGHQVAMSRSKVGIGRYDYSPVTSEIFPTLDGSNVTVTAPITVLANCHSVSMAEITCLGAKKVEGARVIGTTTWGGLCILSPDPKTYSLSYASSVGVMDETPFYAYIPSTVTITQEGILEGQGVEPDIEQPLNLQLLGTHGRDSQLERALQYIHTGN